MNDYKEYLNIAVIQENKPVTYKSLARSLGIHVNTAKQALYEFSKENETNVHAVYCITGTTVKNDQFSIQLVKAAELEDTKKSYRQVTGVHVYSVTSFEPNDFTLLYSACKDIPKLMLEDRVKCGILKNVNVTFKKLAANRLVGTTKPAVVETPFAKTTPVPVAKPASKPAPATITKRKGTLSFGPATIKKQAVEGTKLKAETKKQPISNKSSPKPIPKPIVVSRKKATQMKGKNDHDDIEKRLAKTTIRPEDIFSDEEDEEEEEEKQPEKPQPEEDLEIEDEDDVMEEVEENKEGEDVSEKEENDENVEASSPVIAPVGKAKKKVLRKKTTKNARGLLVTEEVWEWETDDESEVTTAKPTPIKPKVASSSTSKNAPKNSRTTAKKPTAQSNLFSFFKKT